MARKAIQAGQIGVITPVQQSRAACQALRSAHRHGVIDNLLFGSGFPFSSAAQAIEALYSANRLVHETNVPTIPREELRRIVEADALAPLGLSAEVPRGGDRQPEGAIAG